MWCILFFLPALTLGQMWECLGDSSETPLVKIPALSRSSSQAPIRISFKPISLIPSPSGTYDNILNNIIPQVSSYYSNILQIRPVQNNNNIVVSKPTCLGLAVPSTDMSSGVANADIVIYLGSRPFPSVHSNIAAISGACLLDSGLENVVVGGLVLNNNYNFDSLLVGDVFSLLTHHVTHVLGFSSALFQYWRDQNGVKYSSVTQTQTTGGVTKSFITTPNVVKYARLAFGCSTLTGLQLEEYIGVPGSTQNCHWEKRVMFNDYMVSTNVPNPIYSIITFGLLLDSGWYSANPRGWGIPQYPYFGKNAGCGFFDQKCISSDEKANYSGWCTSTTESVCDFMNVAIGKCNVNTGIGGIPAAFAYFSSDPTKGGNDHYTDYCPYIQPQQTNDRCQYYGGYSNNDNGSIKSPKSRCFNTVTYYSPGYNYFAKYSSDCFSLELCTSDSVYIQVGSHITRSNISPTLRTDTFFLDIRVNEICSSEIPCMNGCFGSGRCLKGVCNCLCGRSGNDCSIICPQNCKICNGNSCLLCIQGYHLDQGQCVKGNIIHGCRNNGIICTSCFDGFYLSHGACYDCPRGCEKCFAGDICTKCHPSYKHSVNRCTPICPNDCLTCSTPTYCLSCVDGYYPSNGFCVPCHSSCSKCVNENICLKCKSVFLNFSCIIQNEYTCNLYQMCESPYCHEGTLFAQPLPDGTIYYSTYVDMSFPLQYLALSSCPECRFGCKRCTYNDCISCFPGTSLITITPGYEGAASTTICYANSCDCNCCDCDGSLCLECKKGFYLDDICKPCPIGCSECFSNTTCLSCDDGYYIKNYTCFNCNGRTDVCETPDCCGGCSPGYVMIQGVCQPDCTKWACDPNSLSCDASFYSKSCKNGYYLKYEECYPCSANCLKCTSAVNCIQCEPNYLVINGLCVVSPNCPVNCKTCVGNICTGCNDGYYVLSGICSSCSYGCKKCTSPASCTDCANRFYLNGYICSPCPVGCALCGIGAVCTSCDSGFHLTNGYCYL